MDIFLEFIRLMVGLTTEQLTFMLAFAVVGVAALTVYSITSITKNKDH